MPSLFFEQSFEVYPNCAAQHWIHSLVGTAMTKKHVFLVGHDHKGTPKISIQCAVILLKIKFHKLMALSSPWLYQHVMLNIFKGFPSRKFRILPNHQMSLP